MGLPRLRHPRIPTDLRCLSLVLGLPAHSPDCQRHSHRQSSHIWASIDRDYYAHCCLTLGHWNSLTLRSPRLLPSSARPDPEFLQVSHASQDCALVLRHRPHPELLPIRTVRT